MKSSTRGDQGGRAWALRQLTICVRDYAALAPYARQLVDHMRAGVKGD